MSAKELGVTATCPLFNGSAVLDAKFVSIEEGQGSFDRAIKLSTLNRGKRITLLTKKTAPFNKWSEWPGSRLVQGCVLSEDSLILWFDIPETVKTEGSVLGIDIGVHKLISDSNGDHYGKEFKKVEVRSDAASPAVRAEPGHLESARILSIELSINCLLLASRLLASRLFTI